jgi:hypothetical protein
MNQYFKIQALISSFFVFFVSCSPDTPEQIQEPKIPVVYERTEALNSLPLHVQQRVSRWINSSVKGCDAGDVINLQSSRLYIDSKAVSNSSFFVTKQSGNLAEGFVSLNRLRVPNVKNVTETQDVFTEPTEQTVYKIKTYQKNSSCTLFVNNVEIHTAQLFESAEIDLSWNTSRTETQKLSYSVLEQNNALVFDVGSFTPGNYFFRPREEDIYFVADAWGTSLERARQVLLINYLPNISEQIKVDLPTGVWQNSASIFTFPQVSLGYVILNMKGEGSEIFSHKIVLPEVSSQNMVRPQKNILTKIRASVVNLPGQSPYLKLNVHFSPQLVKE